MKNSDEFDFHRPMKILDGKFEFPTEGICSEVVSSMRAANWFQKVKDRMLTASCRHLCRSRLHSPLVVLCALVDPFFVAWRLTWPGSGQFTRYRSWSSEVPVPAWAFRSATFRFNSYQLATNPLCLQCSWHWHGLLGVDVPFGFTRATFWITSMRPVMITFCDSCLLGFRAVFQAEHCCSARSDCK